MNRAGVNSAMTLGAVVAPGTLTSLRVLDLAFEFDMFGVDHTWRDGVYANAFWPENGRRFLTKVSNAPSV